MSAELLRMAEDALRTILEHCELADDNGYSTLGTSFVSDVCRPAYVAIKEATPPPQPSVSEGSVVEGFVLVPKEPTPEMLDAGVDALQELHATRSYPWSDSRAFYAAMLAAAPQHTTKKG